MERTHFPEQFDQGPVSQKPCCDLRWRLANKPVHFVLLTVKSICKTIEISIFNVHTQQLSGPCKNRDFRETGQQGLYSAGDAIYVYGSSLFLVFPVALKFLRLLRFSPLLKNPANQNLSSIHL